MKKGDEIVSPIRMTDDGNDYVVFELKTTHLYLLYAILAIFCAGYLSKVSLLMAVGVGLFIFYLFLISPQYWALNRKIRRAAKKAFVETSGSKWSFSNPCRIRINKRFL